MTEGNPMPSDQELIEEAKTWIEVDAYCLSSRHLEAALRVIADLETKLALAEAEKEVAIDQTSMQRAWYLERDDAYEKAREKLKLSRKRLEDLKAYEGGKMKLITCVKLDASYEEENGNRVIHIVNVPEDARVEVRNEERGTQRTFTLKELMRLAARSPRMYVEGS